MSNIELVFITDENYAMPTCVAIVSLIYHIKPKNKIIITVLCDNLSELAKSKLRSLERENVIIELIDVDSAPYEKMAVDALNKVPHLKSATLKFFLPDILKNKDKVLYMDGDVLINGDISPLYDMSVEDVYVAAADDMGDYITENGESFYFSRIGLDEKTYFNSGVLLLNLEKMRADNIPQKLLEYKMQKNTYFVDQDAFNAVLCKSRKRLPCKYNFLTRAFEHVDFEEIKARFCEQDFFDMKECIDAQVILHLADRLKPWEYCMPHISELYMHFYYMSPYKEERIALKTPLRQLIRDNIQLQKAVEDLKKRNMYLNRRQEMMEWHFPKEKIPPNCKLVLYGAGVVGKSFVEKIREENYCKIVLWVDKNKTKDMNGVSSPIEIIQHEYDYVLISISKEEYIESAKAELIKIGVTEEKLITLL